MPDVPCGNCNGSGTVSREGQSMSCGSCNGRGTVKR